MKKYGVISDIHSNYPALREVMRRFDDEGVDGILCAGDIVGYNSMPNEVINLLRDRDATCILGNHDRTAVSADYNSMNALAIAAIRWTVSILTPENMNFLKSLGESAILPEIAIYHGSPFEPDDYTYEDMVDERLAAYSGTPFTVLGHTHVPFVKKMSSATVMNPGSVGQPRDGDARASCIILSEAEQRIVRVPYDVEMLISNNMKCGLPLPLSERLRWGV